VRHEGEQAHRLAARVRVAGELEWRSPAAEVFRARVRHRVSALLRAAAAVDAAAEAMEEHAAACEAHLARLGLTRS
jgi:hypothetical protein